MRALLNRDETISFDPSIPLLFPVIPQLRDTTGKKGTRPKDMFDLAKDNGWTGGFYRTATECVSHSAIAFIPALVEQVASTLIIINRVFV